MNSHVVVGLALVLAVASSVVTTVLLTPDAESPTVAVDGADPEVLAGLVGRQAELEVRIAELHRALGAQREPVTGAGEVGPDDVAIERAIERVLARRSAQAAGATRQADAAVTSELLRELSALPFADGARAAVWQKIRDGGHIDAAVAEFERRAEAQPFDATAQTELGWAYFQKMRTTGGGPEAGRWGSRGAALLEKAIGLDPDNWDARYSLAQHFFYADMRGDSVRHLDRLIAQQPGRRAEPRHANTYVLLGNIHFDAGRSGEAKRVWQAGLQLFPGHAVLLGRLRALQ